MVPPSWQPARRASPRPERRRPAPPPAANISDYYDIENITLPDVDPSADGIGVMPDGRVVVSFYNGSVWFYDIRAKTWSTFAEGLHTPLGVLPLSNREVLVMQMPELTLLVDRDGDGRADLYKTVSD